MRKSVCVILICCIQFVLWTNLAIAKQYVTASANKSNTTHVIENNNLLVMPMSNDTTFTLSLVTTFDTGESKSQQVIVDLCLPEVIVKNDIPTQQHLAMRNEGRAFSKVTWQPLSALKPPIRSLGNDTLKLMA